jgi:hypothetical protein
LKGRATSKPPPNPARFIRGEDYCLREGDPNAEVNALTAAGVAHAATRRR